jgi:RNA polymerase sigma-70 factor (ECF subfamily)
LRQIIPVDRFEALLVEEIPALRRYARALCRDSAQVDDLVQECLLRAVSRRRLWLSQKGMRPWLFTILHNIFVNTLRRNVNSPSSGLAEPFEDSFVSDDDPHDLCTLSDFEAALCRLSPEQREVLLLVGLEQMSYKDVSKIVGVPVGTVMSRLSRARSSLREGLAGAVSTARIKRVK